MIIIYFFTLKISTSTYEESKRKTSFAFHSTHFFSCEKADLAGDTSVYPTGNQNDIALHALAKLLVEDKANGGEFVQKQVEWFGQTGVEEFFLAEFVETGINFRTPSAVQQLLAQNPLMEIAYPSYAFFEGSETFAQHISNIQYYVVI
ncbi:MAG TPA: hypothetical protein PKE68_11455 [Saprospiraceae bacterium]|nr:hypothetical protein [Saprospiraceae bacterium]